MKKFTLFLVAMTMSLFSFAAQPKRIYAYDLSSALVDKVYTFSFTANETPTSGKIIFYDATSGELVGEIALTTPVLGKNDVEIAEYSLPGNDGQQLNWSVELSAAEVTAFEAVYTGIKKYGRGHATIDNSPESDYFGRVYVTDRRTSNSKSGLYVYTPDLQLINNTVYALGRDESGYARPAVAADGTLFLADYTDARRSGIWVVNPSDLTTCTQFYNGTRASSGLFTNAAGKEIGSSTSGVGIYGSGANTVLYTMMEDGTNASSAVCYHIGQLDGSILKTWSDVPTWICTAYASINPSTNNAFAATEKGVWVSQNDGVTGRKELAFIDNTGVLQYSIDNGKCEGAGLAVNSDNSKLFICGSTSILEYDVVWDGKTPALALKQTHTISDRYVSTLSFDYAGNLLACTGASYSGTDSDVMRLIQYTIPTDNNTCEVPAKKAYIVTKKEADVTLYTVTTQVVGEGSITGNLGTYEAGASAELTAVANEHYDFVNWTVGESVVSEEATYSFDVTENVTITANFEKKSYTLTVNVNDGTKGSVNITSGTYEAEEEVEITATANTNYEFAGWSNGSKENPLTITMEENTELTANFRAILPTSITLYAHPTKDYSTSIVGKLKRAIQNGENTIVLTHEDNGTPHIYNIAHATKEVTEISQVGVVAVDPDNAGDFRAISDIALTDDGKLVACNYMMCQITANEVDAGYKRGTSRFYIWDNLGGDPRLWISSQLTGNYYRASMGYTMALKGTSMNAEVTISAFNKTNANTRYSHLYVVDGAYSDANYKYSRENAALHPSTLGPNTYELNASPLAAGKWIVDGELASPIEFVEKNAVAIDTYTALNTNVLGKKYNGASYLFHNDHHLMVAPYADGDGKLAGVKVLGITDGFANPAIVETNATLANAIDATTAAATAYVDTDGDLTIYLIADGKVYTFSEKEFTAPQYTINAHADHTSKGYVTGGGDYYEGEEVVLKATAKSGYYFTQWNDGNTATPRTITVTGAAEYIAEFAEAQPRAWAYDMKLGEDGDNYTFTFKATAAGQATITFKDKDGNALAQPASQTMEAGVGENKFTIAKDAFVAGVDAFWSITMEGDPIPAIAEVTDQTRGIYDFYNMMGVVVDNNTDSKDFGKIYVQASLNGKSGGITDRAKAQKAGIFIYNQDLDELNDPSNTGYKPTVPSGYTEIGSSSSAFQRLNIHPKTGNLVFSHAIEGKPAVFAINREDMTGDVTNLLTGVADMTRSVAHCFDAEGMLYVMDFADEEGTVYKVINGEATPFTATSDKFINPYITIASDGRGGLWISQNRGQFDAEPYPAFYQLAHVTSTGEFDWVVNRDTPHGLEGSSYRGALAYDVERKILAQGRNGKVELYTVSYEPTIELTPLYTIASDDLGTNIDGLAFDYAGDLYVVNSSKEKFQKFTLPTADNICTVAAPALEAVRFTPVYTVSVASNNNEWGIANGGGTFEKDQRATITAVAATNYKFVNWTKDDVEVSTENPYTFAVTESATYVANFVEKTTYTINVTYDNTMGIVTGVGSYYEGTEVTLTATANTGYRFLNWTYGSETSTNNSLELVVEGNITVTANFEPVQYTLIAPTNDENKGTVSVDGVCTHGSTVTLTATAKPGYKLLYWSDRSTENPRTITMTKNEAISAYFVKEYTEEPTFKIEKMWENTKVPASTGNGFQAVGWDGKIYMQNKAAGKIQVFSNETDAPVDYATSGSGQKIAVDEAGNMIVCNSTFAAATNNKVLIYLKGSTEGKEVSFTLLQDGRCDFFSASGNIYSAEGGYVYFYCQSTTVVNRVKIANGELVSVDVVGNNITAGNSQNHVMVDIFGNLVAHSRSAVINATINVHTNESMPFALIDHKYGTLGGCSFELGGKELWAYHAGATNYSSEWNIYNMTDSKFLSDDDFYAVDKDNSTNNAANWLNVQVVDENTAYIYQFCPKKAVAMWKVSINRTDLQEFTVTASANDPTMGTVTGGDTYYEEATATLIATPNAGYRFVNWTKASEEVSTDATYTFTVTEDVELVANFAPLPEITYELNGGVWNTYGWTSKKDMYDAFIADWKAYSGSTRGTIPYEDQFGIGKSNAGIPTTIQESEPIMEFMTQDKWEWLGQFLDALAIAQGKETMPTTAVKQMRFGLGNFFGEDNNQTGWVGAVDCSGDKASLSAFAPYWGQTFPMPTQPTEEVVLNAPYREGCEFGGWFVTSDFSGAAVTTVDQNTDGMLYAKWIENFYTRTVTPGHYGTICLPYGSSSYSGAEFYEVSWLQKSGETPVNLYLDQLAEGTQLVAGKPYIFRATSTELTVTYTGAPVADPIEGANGLTGSFDPLPAGSLTGKYVIAQDKFWTATATAYAAENRAYIEPTLVPTSEQKQIPGRRRVALGTSGENAESGFEDIIAPESKVVKVIENGQLIIIRDGVKYNAQGVRL